jgi:hypothetical protein
MVPGFATAGVAGMILNSVSLRLRAPADADDEEGAEEEEAELADAVFVGDAAVVELLLDEPHPASNPASAIGRRTAMRLICTSDDWVAGLVDVPDHRIVPASWLDTLEV